MDAFVGEIRAFGFNFVPEYWLACDGQTYQIRLYSALAAVLGQRFGGDGQNTFGVPNLKVRMPFGAGTSDYGRVCTFARPAGASTYTLTPQNLPQHTHAATFTPSAMTPLSVAVAVSTAEATQPSPAGKYLAASSGGVETYALPDATSQVKLGGVSAQITGGTGTVTVSPAGLATPMPIGLLPSHVAMQFCICYEGVYPQPT